MSDVCFLLEGTYPYVAGGVSTWVHDLITRMKDITFSVVYLGPHPPTAKKLHYEIPANVVDFKEFYLFDYRVLQERRKIEKESEFEVVGDFLSLLRKVNPTLFDKLVEVAGNAKTRTVDLYDLAHSFNSWKMLRRLYEAEDEEQSFIDYFWTWRFVYLPLFSLLRIDLPPAKLYHSVSTGYAGVLAVLGKLQHRRPFLLTEHGIYTRERKIEIAQADWIYSEAADQITVTEEKEFFKDWWTNLFSFLSRLAYDKADEIITLYEGNRQVQIEEGADPKKTRLIPNGIDVNVFSSMKKAPSNGKFRIGFMGRVVPIKDVKTFIRACKIVYDELKDVEVYIMGPTDEDEDYYRECGLLVNMQSMQDIIHFTGKVNVHNYYPKLDVLVLTSISEGQPIVILEAAACGIPSVATDVGSCSELLYGRSPDDRLLGQSGIITPICNPHATAQAIIRLLRDRTSYARMAAAGRRRVKTYYHVNNLIANYESLYFRYMEEVRWRE